MRIGYWLLITGMALGVLTCTRTAQAGNGSVQSGYGASARPGAWGPGTGVIPSPSQIPINFGVWSGADQPRDVALYRCGYYRGMYRFHTGNTRGCVTMYGAQQP